MKVAWEQILANKGRPGIDEVTLTRWSRNWEANIERLREQVRSNTYRPNRPKRFVVFKKGGGLRELSRLTVSDKVLQRATLNVIEGTFESRFLGCSHGYRPGRSVATAVKQVLRYRDRGLQWVLDADITACFDSLDHEILMGEIRKVITDWFVLNLMELWLKAGRRRRARAVGVPMGAVISPLWCNIYLHKMDVQLTAQRWRLVRYADDFLVMAASEELALQAREATGSILKGIKLDLSIDKTDVVSFDEGFQFLGVEFLRDTYTYNSEKKRIEVRGKDVRWLFRYPPPYYRY